MLSVLFTQPTFSNISNVVDDDSILLITVSIMKINTIDGRAEKNDVLVVKINIKSIINRIQNIVDSSNDIDTIPLLLGLGSSPTHDLLERVFLAIPLAAI